MMRIRTDFTEAPMTRPLICSLLLTLVACADAPMDSFGGPHFIPDEKSDSETYVSTNAREFILSGKVHADLPENFDTLEGEAKDKAVANAISSRLNHVSRSVKRHIDDVLRANNGGVTGEKANYFTYFRRQNSAESGDFEVVGDQVAFMFEMDLVGSYYLMHLLAPGEASRRTFEVEVSDYRGAANPEKVTVTVRGSEAKDAFPKYNELFADGLLDMGIHFGGDYNEGRHDIETAKWLVEYLLESKWENPTVTRFEDLKIDSPPFRSEVIVEGRKVVVEVYITHSDMVEVADEQKLTEAVEKSFAERDIVMYSGHADENAGFILDYQPRHEIKAKDFAELKMADKYQIFVLDGCRTYRTYVQDLMANPAKSDHNVDIVTTVNTTPFSAGYYLLFEFMNWLTITNQDGAHYPLSWKTILRGVNKPSFKNVHYGVHGVAGNPQLNPHASQGIMCSPCSVDADCGAGGNLCLSYAGSAGCGVACTNDTACGPGYRCARLTDDPDMFYIPKQCVRRDYICP